MSEGSFVVLTRRLKDSRFRFEERGEMEIKGKGRMVTYFLVSRKEKSTLDLSDISHTINNGRPDDDHFGKPQLQADNKLADASGKSRSCLLF